MICRTIILEGVVPLTAEMLRKEAENKRKQIIDIIHRNVIDPNTGKPHPSQRIDASMNDAKVRIDASKSADQQVKEIIDKIRAIIPIKFEIRELTLKIPSNYASKSMAVLKKYSKIIGESWQNDGILSVTLEIPAGMQEEFEIALNNLTKGQMIVEGVRSR